jgi:hypothetical protein
MPFDIHIYSSLSITWLENDLDKDVESVERVEESVMRSSRVVDDVFHSTGHVDMSCSSFGARRLEHHGPVRINALSSAISLMQDD